MLKLNQVEKGAILASGNYGSVYKVINNESVIIKVERILIDNLAWVLENMFAFEMGSLYPQHFLQLYDYVTTQKM